MKGYVKSVLIMTLVFTFAANFTSCTASRGGTYKKGKKKRKKGCNCPTFSAQTITLEAAQMRFLNV
jgi:hypothetical protein